MNSTLTSDQKNRQAEMWERAAMTAARAMTLEEIAEFAKAHKVTPAERRAQRVSLMMGLQSKKSSLTREQASDLLDQIEGHETQGKTPEHD